MTLLVIAAIVYVILISAFSIVIAKQPHYVNTSQLVRRVVEMSAVFIIMVGCICWEWLT